MAKTQPIYITADGAAKLEVELKELKGPKREALARRLRDAIQMGDLSENADYHKAKEDQGFLEGRIQDLEYSLSHAIIIEEGNGARDTVQVGAHVTVQEDDYPADTYFLVGAKEADPRSGRISNESPIGRALLGKMVGDIVVVQTPGGEVRLKILKIE